MKSQSHKTLLATAFILFVIAALAYGYMNRTVDISVANTTDMYSKIKSEDAIRLESKSLTTLFSDTAADRAKIRSSILSTGKVVDLIVAIESIGLKSGSKVTIVSITPTPDQASSTTSEVNMEVAVVGPWKSVMRALVLVETLPHVSTIDSARLDASGKGNWSLDLKLRAPTLNKI